ncbi:MAG: hypothetical protein IKN04_11850 [Clostridia bacterium]|nr:hypothetical protein [Clostridia bacterium]
MKPMENNEQWKGGGVCGKCRRVNYCKTECRARKTYRRQMILSIMRQRAAATMQKADKKA